MKEEITNEKISILLDINIVGKRSLDGKENSKHYLR